MNFPSPVFRHRGTRSLDTLSAPELLALLETAGRLKQAAQAGLWSASLRGKQIALLGDGDATGLFRAAASELGAKVTSLYADGVSGSNGSSRVLGRLYDAVDCTAPVSAVEVEREAGIPVFDGIGGDGHPARALAALLTIRDATARPLRDLRIALVGDIDSPCGKALAKAAARIGFELLVAAHADAARDADFVLDIRDRARWTLVDRDGGVHDNEQEDRRFALQALLVSTLT